MRTVLGFKFGDLFFQDSEEMIGGPVHSRIYVQTLVKEVPWYDSMDKRDDLQIEEKVLVSARITCLLPYHCNYRLKERKPRTKTNT